MRWADWQRLEVLEEIDRARVRGVWCGAMWWPAGTFALTGPQLLELRELRGRARKQKTPASQNAGVVPTSDY